MECQQRASGTESASKLADLRLRRVCWSTRAQQRDEGRTVSKVSDIAHLLVRLLRVLALELRRHSLHWRLLTHTAVFTLDCLHKHELTRVTVTGGWRIASSSSANGTFCAKISYSTIANEYTSAFSLYGLPCVGFKGARAQQSRTQKESLPR